MAAMLLAGAMGACDTQDDPAPEAVAQLPSPTPTPSRPAPDPATPASAVVDPAGEALEFVCRSHPGFDSDQPLMLARVASTPAGRTYFHDDRSGCPASAGCQRKAYLVPGDEVIIDRVAHGWACAWFGDGRTPTMGYLRAADLEMLGGRHATSGSDWVGGWEQIPAGDGEPVATLLFSLHHDGLRVAGEAQWFGNTVDGERVVHTGNIEVDGLEADTDHTSFQPPDEFECGASFRLHGDFLVADDNGHCGGMNVTFDGIYRRLAPDTGGSP
jgi:hypothetical protein